MDLNGRKFKAIQNSNSGEVNESTIFHYQTNPSLVEATYSGGRILKGHLIGEYTAVDEIYFVYHHLNLEGELCAGKCTSKIISLDSGKLQLEESWEWTLGRKGKGTSILKKL